MILNQKIRSIRMDDELYKAVKEHAEKKKTTLAKVVRTALRKVIGRENNE